MSDPELEVLWKRVVDDWSNDKTHSAFVAYCRVTQQLGAAAAHYRAEAESADLPYRADVERIESAKKRLAAIAVIAAAELSATRSDPARGVSTWRRVVRWGAALILTLSIAVVILNFMSR